MWGRFPDIFLGFEVQKDRLEIVGAVRTGGVEMLTFPLTRRIAYTTACCYRTSRDSSYKCCNVVSEAGGQFIAERRTSGSLS